MMIIILLLASTLVLCLLLWEAYRRLKQREIAYNTLMSKYQLEKEQRENPVSHVGSNPNSTLPDQPVESSTDDLRVYRFGLKLPQNISANRFLPTM